MKEKPLTAGETATSERANVPLIDPRHLHVVLNPASGNGRALKRWPAILDTFTAHGYEVTAVHTSGPCDAIRIAREFVESGAHTIVAVGGDGTVNEVINGMIKDDIPINAEARLLVVPCGTGKDLGRTLGTGEAERALRALSDNSVAHMDLGRIRFQNADGVEETRYFANVADLGLGAAVARRINHSSKALGGLVTYLVAAVRTIFEFSPHAIQVDIGEDRIFDAMANIVVLANGRYFAGGMEVAPTASICDGLVEMYILADVGKRAMLTSLLPRIYTGKHVGQPGVLHVRASSVSIACKDGMLLEMDGEQIGTSPVHVDVVPGVLPVVMDAGALRADAGCAKGPS